MFLQKYGVYYLIIFYTEISLKVVIIYYILIFNLCYSFFNFVSFLSIKIIFLVSYIFHFCVIL